MAATHLARRALVRPAVGVILVAFLVACGDSGGDEPDSTGAPALQSFRDSAEYRLAISIPATWAAVPSDLGHRFEGENGFLLLTPLPGTDDLDATALALTNQPERPYGSNPQIETVVAGPGEARLIRPWTDQDGARQGQTALLVPRDPAMTVAGSTYRYLLIDADGEHAGDIFASLILLDE